LKKNNLKVVAAIRGGSYLDAKTLARDARAFNDVASISEWLVALMRVAAVSDTKRFDNRLNNALSTKNFCAKTYDQGTASFGRGEVLCSDCSIKKPRDGFPLSYEVRE
jgi:hypothetical protein